MTNEKAYVPPPPEADGNYKYYLIGSINAVRVEFDERGSVYVAETPDEQKGSLVVDYSGLRRIDKDELDVSEITKEDFVAACQRAALKNPNRDNS